MNCLRCASQVLDEQVREGVVIDICPTCRGVWLDRGELEKLLARLGRADADEDGEDGGYDEDDSDDRRRARGRRRFDDDDDDDERNPRRAGDRGGWLGTLSRMFD